jgi:hypothetical protein
MADGFNVSAEIALSSLHQTPLWSQELRCCRCAKVCEALQVNLVEVVVADIWLGCLCGSPQPASCGQCKRSLHRIGRPCIRTPLILHAPFLSVAVQVSMEMINVLGLIKPLQHEKSCCSNPVPACCLKSILPSASPSTSLQCRWLQPKQI